MDVNIVQIPRRRLENEMSDFLEQLAESRDTVFEIVGRPGILFCVVSEDFVNKKIEGNHQNDVNITIEDLLEPDENVNNDVNKFVMDVYAARRRVGELRKKAKQQMDFLDDADSEELARILKKFNLK